MNLVKSEDFNKASFFSPQQLIQGKVAGVSIVTNSGAPGEGSNVLIRDIAASEVADKAISVGEESTLNIENLNISDSRIGIASKDSSKVEGKKIRNILFVRN